MKTQNSIQQLETQFTRFVEQEIISACEVPVQATIRESREAGFVMPALAACGAVALTASRIDRMETWQQALAISAVAGLAFYAVKKSGKRRRRAR